jgi:hypothetical protein
VPNPDNVTALLRACSGMVLSVTKLSVYATNTDTGLASDPNILNCMRDATCIQAAAWMTLGIDPLAGGVQVTAVKASKGIGSARIQYADAAQAAEARAAATRYLVPAAIDKLRSQNLISYWPSREYGWGNTPGIWPNLV